MRKTALLVLLLVFSLAGCGIQAGNHTDAGSVGPGRPIAAYIGDYVSNIEITHSVDGAEDTWTAEGEEVQRLRSWADGLKYEILKVEAGNTPADAADVEVYEFVLTEGDYPGFSYVVNAGGSYLLIEGCWYTVTNPSTPPCAAP